jgi:hypothetical protein
MFTSDGCFPLNISIYSDDRIEIYIIIYGALRKVFGAR